ncbi:MAG: hypothetical protein ABI462_09645 [Ignavibacteria bacterium]
MESNNSHHITIPNPDPIKTGTLNYPLKATKWRAILVKRNALHYRKGY